MSHPYYPQDILIPNFTPQLHSTKDILTIFFFGLLVLGISGIYKFKTRDISKLLKSDVSSVYVYLWFLLCGFIHLFVEGYFVVTNKTIAGDMTFLASLWKEYGKSDSRYLTSDPSVLMIEAITCALWGPLSFYAAYASLKNLPSRHLIQFLVSTGQLYGDILYYSTTLIEGAPHCRPEPFYFWVYFVAFNAPWIIIPLMIMITSGKKIHESLNMNSGLKKVQTRSQELTSPSTPKRVTRSTPRKKEL